MISLKSNPFPLVIMLIVPLVSCRDTQYQQMRTGQPKVQDSINSAIQGMVAKIPSNKFETINIDGCEYLIYKEESDSNSAFGFMAHKGCLLYTSDAADDLTRVDLGGR